MHQLRFYLDFISPYAYLAFHALPKALQGLSYQVSYQPILFGAVLQHHGQLGPAEIAAKRDWTYRQVQWQARTQGTPLQLPASHPFNSLALLRLATACDPAGEPNRFVCDKLFRHVWCSGQDAVDPARLAALTVELAPQADPQSAEVKDRLKVNTDEALALNLFGVPSLVVDGQVFWGNDALPMLRAYLLGDPWFQSPEWTGVSALPVGVQRKV
jgi:2-hydroxychromene-2-carboxylate isomerase